MPAPVHRSRIQLDSSLRRWFHRNLGQWRSRRTLYFPDNEILQFDLRLQVEEITATTEGEAGYRFTWWSEHDEGVSERKPGYQRAGSITAHLWGHQLEGSCGYSFCSPSESQIRQVDEHELIFESLNQGWQILDHIRLVDQGRFRARSIYAWFDGSLDLVETHHDCRLPSDTPAAVPSD
ncbi:hypothetical protein KQ310_03225 [Synechococcus sp. CS-1328]|nr:hypothetical protein [Synechococcus sp. CS-1328]